MRKVLSTFLIAATGGALALGGYSYLQPKHGLSASSFSAAMPVAYSGGALPEGSVNFTTAAEMSVNSVVHIKTKATVNQGNFSNDPFFEFFFGAPGMGQERVQMGSGSGVIISSDGYIATNNHVVAGAEEVEVILNNKKTYTAKVIGKDPSTDLALIKIEESNLPFMVYGNSDDVKVGEWVLAVGNPFNLTSTVTAGIVSAKGRNINIIGGGDPRGNVSPIESFIQTDAAVNPGNSGGALVNTGGHLIGINTAIASNTGSYSGYSFAVPVNIVKKVMDDLLEFGEVQRAFLGVSIRDIDNQLAKDKGITDLNGVYISGLSEGGSAEDAGLKEGDIIKKVGNVEVASTAQLQEQIGKYRPGDKVNLTVLRDSREKLVGLVLKNRNGNVGVVKKSNSENVSSLGASFEEISAEERKDLRIDYGMRVSSLGAGKLRSAGVKPGFIITSIDKKPIKSLEDLNNALDDKKGGVLIEGVYPNGLRAYYGFGM